MSSNASGLEHTHNAILSSFSRDELRQSVQFALGLPLDAITADKALESQVFDLLLWTARTGRSLDLISCLLASRPQNRELAAAAEALWGAQPMDVDMVATAVNAPTQQSAHQFTHPPFQPPTQGAHPLPGPLPVPPVSISFTATGGHTAVGSHISTALHVPLHKPLRTQPFIGRAAELTRLLADLPGGRTVTLCGPGGSARRRWRRKRSGRWRPAAFLPHVSRTASSFILSIGSRRPGWRWRPSHAPLARTRGRPRATPHARRWLASWR